MLSGVDTSPVVGSYTDCAGAPREPYRPARHDFRVDGGRKGRRHGRTTLQGPPDLSLGAWPANVPAPRAR